MGVRRTSTEQVQAVFNRASPQERSRDLRDERLAGRKDVRGAAVTIDVSSVGGGGTIAGAGRKVSRDGMIPAALYS